MVQQVRSCCCLVALLSTILAPALAKHQNGSATRPAPQDDDTVRISTRLVQVDGTVTSKDGREITDLGKDDFELIVDGRPQTITFFTYIAAPSVSVANPTEKLVPPSPSATERLRPGQARRTIAIVVANVSFESMPGVKRALNQFVDKEMRPGDLVSITRPAQGAGVLQQLTSEKRLLHLAIDHLRWNPVGGVSVSAVPQDQTRPNPTTTATPEIGEKKGIANSRADDFHDDVIASSWVRSLDLIVRNLNDLPGRKSVILFSDGLRLLGKDMPNQRTLEALHRITDRATRALVVVNAIDSRGLDTLIGGAEENIDLPPEIGTPVNTPPSINGPDLAAVRQTRVSKFISAQDGLVALAEETGGRFMQSTDLAGAMTRMVDQKGYYVLGYRPDESTFKLEAGGRPYHEIKVSVRRPNLLAHFRKGFFGTPDKEQNPQQRTNPEKMVAALTSPLAASDVGLRMTSLFGYDRAEGSFVRSLLHIDVGSLTFTERSGGWNDASIHVLAAAFEANGLVADPVAQDKFLHVRDEDLERLKRDGLVYEMTIPVRKTGVYQVRAAVRDMTSDRIGSASQLIDVPDINSKRLILSGIVVSGTSPEKGGRATTASETNDVQAGPAIRKFQRGMQLTYGLLALNPQIDRGAGRPQVEMQVLLYRDGKAVYKGAVRKIEVGREADPRAIPLTGILNLGTDLALGEYVLQVIVFDKLAREKNLQTVTAWIDFDLVPEV